MNKKQNLAVIIVNWQNMAETIDAVTAIRNWGKFDPRLIVVDNRPKVADRDHLERHLATDQLVVSGCNAGYGGGNNLGISLAISERREFVLLLNTDATISETGVAQLLRHLNQCPDIAAIGPVLEETERDTTKRYMGGRDIAENVFTRIDVDHNSVSSGNKRPLVDVEYVPGTVFLARTSLFEDIGLLEESYFFSGEVADLCKRARNAGHRVCIDPNVIAQHETAHAPSKMRSTLYAYYSLRNRFVYIRRQYHRRRFRFFFLWTWRGMVALIGQMSNSQWQESRATALAIAHGLANVTGNRNHLFDVAGKPTRDQLGSHKP